MAYQLFQREFGTLSKAFINAVPDSREKNMRVMLDGSFADLMSH